MPNEEIESHVENVVPADENPTDEDLLAAFDELMADDEGESETPEVEDSENLEDTNHVETPPEPANEDQHREESNLGRKVASINRKIENMATKDDLHQIISKLDNLARVKRADPFEEPEEDELFEEELNLNDPKQLSKFLDKREETKKRDAEERAREDNINYQKGYIGVMTDLLEEVDDVVTRQKIKLEMVKNNGEFNKRYSNNPAADCAKNFTKAFKFATTKHSVFDKKDRVPNVPTGTNTPETGKNAPSESLKHELDEFSAALVKRTGMSVKDINEALDGDVSPGLRRRNG